MQREPHPQPNFRRRHRVRRGTIGSCSGKGAKSPRNRRLTKFEARNPKLETISNDKKIQCSKQSRFGPEFWILIFRVLKLFRISIFEFRKQAWRDDLLPSSPCLLVYGSRALYPAQRLFELAAQIGSGMPPVDKFFAIEQRQHRGFFGSEIVHGVPRLFA